MSRKGGKDEVNIDMICAVDVQNPKYVVKLVVFLWRSPQWSIRTLSYFGEGEESRSELDMCRKSNLLPIVSRVLAKIVATKLLVFVELVREHCPNHMCPLLVPFFMICY